MTQCPECLRDKPLVARKDRPNGLKRCQECWNKLNVQQVLNTRRKHKEILVAEHGGKCVDCGDVHAPFVMQFDHRDPSKKAFGLSGKFQTASLARKRAEAAKCDLVCGNCHAWRTHRQRCAGCKYCDSGS